MIAPFGEDRAAPAGTPERLSSSRFGSEKLLIGVMPFDVKMKSHPSIRGIRSSTASAALDSGLVISVLVLLLLAGNVHTSPSISSRRIPAISLRRALVSSASLINAENGCPSAVAAHTARISSSSRMRVRRCSTVFWRDPMPLITGERQSSVRVSCQWKIRRNTPSVTSAILGPAPLSILSSSRTMSERLTVSIGIAPSAG